MISIAIAIAIGVGLFFIPILLNPSVDHRDVAIGIVHQKQFQPLISAQAVAVDTAAVIVTASENGQIITQHHRNGAHVLAGDLVLTLSSPTLERDVADSLSHLSEQASNLDSQADQLSNQATEARARTRDAEYRAQTAGSQLSRYTQLEAAGFLSAAKMEQARADAAYAQRVAVEARRDAGMAEERMRSRRGQLAVARKLIEEQITQQRSRFDRLSVTAPIAGVVTDLALTLGAAVRPQDALFRISSGQASGLAASVPSDVAKQLRLGGRARLYGMGWNLVITAIDPVAQNGDVTVALAANDNARLPLRIGQTQNVELELGLPRRALTIPYGDALGSDSALLIQTDGRWAKARPVVFGERAGSQIEVISGLQQGDRVIIESATPLNQAKTLRLR